MGIEYRTKRTGKSRLIKFAKLRAEFEVPEEVGDLSSDMLFADYLLEWLEIAKGRLAVATYCSYTAMIKNPIAPYFRKKKLTLRELEARHLQMFYSEQLKKVKITSAQAMETGLALPESGDFGSRWEDGETQI